MMPLMSRRAGFPMKTSKRGDRETEEMGGSVKASESKSQFSSMLTSSRGVKPSSLPANRRDKEAHVKFNVRNILIPFFYILYHNPVDMNAFRGPIQSCFLLGVKFARK
uniref:Uncharacterized protein n=1 Tax=Odontella aurita TaxID=265563 RepID=A0A7S4JSC7_9STRA|mmetsp:Transcript_52316/g.157041  ORF Transcript_52316/g.157041 Transcript_52316/m.157041 type:complete len:108 (+) Transcript_52316:1086-1409(+)